MVVENLRYMLKQYNTSDPLFFGYKFKPFVKQGYFSGGAGYVLSREALNRFVLQALSDETGILCRKSNGGAEDVEMGKCMESVGVSKLYPEAYKKGHLKLDTVDSLSRHIMLRDLLT
jgi:glycoprotein-N-acetylgalactosamine 3-beta-galactosyltransferase